jgi:hypothetical protein
MYFWLPNSPKKAALCSLELGAVECVHTVIQDRATYQNKEQPGINISLQGCVPEIAMSFGIPSGGYDKRNVFLTCTLSWQMFPFYHMFPLCFFLPQQPAHIRNAAPSLSTIIHLSACGYATLLQHSSRDDDSEEPTPFLCTAVAIIRLWGVSTKKSMEHALVFLKSYTTILQ